VLDVGDACWSAIGRAEVTALPGHIRARRTDGRRRIGATHFFQNADDPPMPSYGPCPFGGGAGYRRVCLTQSNFENPASLR